MSFAPIKVIKRPNYNGVMKVHVQKLQSPTLHINGGETPYYESVATFYPEDIPLVHAALTKYLAEENATSN